MLTYDLSKKGPRSLYDQLYRCIRTDMEDGIIGAGEKLPSKRSFAKHLGVSTITVEAAYEQLVSEGYVRAVERSGYYTCDIPQTSAEHMEDVNDALADDDLAHRPRSESLADVPQLSSTSSPLADLTGAETGLDLFPYETWAKTIRSVLSEESTRTLLGETRPFGLLRLREAIASYLQGSRGMHVDPHRIVIGAGAQMLYSLMVQLLGRTTRFAVEDPGYARLSKIYQANDVSLVHVPLDGSGISIQHLQESLASVAHIMPSHQYPTGLITPIARRRELLAWAMAKPDRYIIEDDYDCEFRLSGRPVPTLQSIDTGQRVIYVNTFTRSLGAAFRIGYMVLPDHLAERYRRDFDFYTCAVSNIDQLALARFIEQGDYERHVNRVRTHARKTQEALIAAIRQTCSDQITFQGEGNGLHFVMEVRRRVAADESLLAQRLGDEGIVLLPFSLFRAKPSGQDEPARFVINCAGVEQEAVPGVASEIARILCRG